ncbi:MAG: hypothetical protein GY856_50675 [bacterium]|nr:hypothetical protein [bacterium]
MIKRAGRDEEDRVFRLLVEDVEGELDCSAGGRSGAPSPISFNHGPGPRERHG